MVFEIIGFVIALIILSSAIRLIYQYERGVIFTLGKYSHVLNPGLNFIIPIIQTMRKDNIPLLANAVVYFKVERPEDVIIKIEDFEFAVKQFTQAALRDVIGNAELDTALTEREKIATNIKAIVDSETSGWGINIESIKIQEMELPAEMKRAMAKQAEAEREKRAVIIAAEGELKASENLKKAAETLSKNPAAIHLRTLQTIRDIAADPSEKIVLFLPSDMGEIAKKLINK